MRGACEGQLTGWVGFSSSFPSVFQRAPSSPEFAQPRLSRVKLRSSPTRGYKFGCVCSYMAGHEDVRVVAGHIGTNTPKFVPPRWGRPPFDPTQKGLCKFGWVWSSLCWLSCSLWSWDKRQESPGRIQKNLRKSPGAFQETLWARVILEEGKRPPPPRQDSVFELY